MISVNSWTVLRPVSSTDWCSAVAEQTPLQAPFCFPLLSLQRGLLNLSYFSSPHFVQPEQDGHLSLYPKAQSLLCPTNPLEYHCFHPELFVTYVLHEVYFLSLSPLSFYLQLRVHYSYSSPAGTFTVHPTHTPVVLLLFSPMHFSFTSSDPLDVDGFCVFISFHPAISSSSPLEHLGLMITENTNEQQLTTLRRMELAQQLAF